ncbi:MAG: hypothetical protein R2825_27730 [Saprospiraceae bacterium]
MPQPTPPHILPFHHLMRMLKMNGFILGVDSYVRVVEYWQQMVGETELIREEAKAQLGALLCRSEEQQMRFGQLFDTFLPPNLQPLDDREDTPTDDRPKPQRSSGRTDSKPASPPPPAVPPPPPASTSNSESLGQYCRSSISCITPPARISPMGQSVDPAAGKSSGDSLEWDAPATIRPSSKRAATQNLFSKTEI